MISCLEQRHSKIRPASVLQGSVNSNKCRDTLNVKFAAVPLALSKLCICGTRHARKGGCKANVERLRARLTELQGPQKHVHLQGDTDLVMSTVKKEVKDWAGATSSRAADAVEIERKRCQEMEERGYKAKRQLDAAEAVAKQARQLLEEHDNQLTRQRTQLTLERVNWTHARGELNDFREEWNKRLCELEKNADALTKRLDQTDDLSLRLKRIEDTAAVLTDRMLEYTGQPTEAGTEQDEALWSRHASRPYSKWEPSSPPVKRSDELSLDGNVFSEKDATPGGSPKWGLTEAAFVGCTESAL